MIIADVIVRFSTIDVILRDKVPCGATGLKVRFQFLDPAWNPMKKIAVFRNRSQTLDVEIVEDCATIPHELLVKVRDTLDVGVYGTDSEQTLGIPTLWGSLGLVESAADPSGDPAMDPTLPYWALIKEQVDMLENTILGNDDPESVRVSALRTSGGKMSGNIDMCGNTVTGLRTPTEDTDAATKGYVRTAAAPAGFGLGGNAKQIEWSEIDNIWQNGNYCGFIDGGVYLYGIFIGYFELRVDAYDVNSVVQTLCETNLGYMLQRKKHHFADTDSYRWDEWECLNPPMIPGQEYRITKRWNGMPVYAMTVDCGNMPDGNTYKGVMVNISHAGWVKPIFCNGQTSNHGVLPIKYVDANEQWISATKGGYEGTITIDMYGGVASWTATAYVEYVKL